MEIISGKIAKAQKVVIYGPEGVGKSTLASMFPDPLFMDLEGGTNNMDLRRLPAPSSLTMVLEEVEFVYKERPCKTLVIDTADWLERLVIQYVCDVANKDSITKFGYGEGYIQLEEKFGKLLNRLIDLIDIGINVVITAHAKLNKFEQPDEMGAYDRYELKLGNKTTAKTSSLLKEWADLLLFCNYKTLVVSTDDKGKKFKGQGGKRVMYTTHHPAWDAKNRHDLPEELDMDYKHIAHIFENVTVAPPSKEQTPAPEPVKEEPKEEEPVATTQEPTQATTSDMTGVDEDVPYNQEKEEKDEVPALFKVPSNIPKNLRDLMEQGLVSVEELQKIVAQKGYFPEDTPIDNYPQDFIDGVLVGAWQQVFGAITEMRKNYKSPFDK